MQFKDLTTEIVCDLSPVEPVVYLGTKPVQDRDWQEPEPDAGIPAGEMGLEPGDYIAVWCPVNEQWWQAVVL